MPLYIALLRGINVGGRNRLPMADLQTCLSATGATDVQTYIQSGNAVFKSMADPVDLDRRIADQIQTVAGFTPQVMVLPADRFRAIAAGNPYADLADAEKSVHVWFLDGPSATSHSEINDRCSASEQLRLSDDALYLYAPDGIGRSKLANAMERLLGTTATARNWRTIGKLLELLDQMSGGLR